MSDRNTSDLIALSQSVKDELEIHYISLSSLADKFLKGNSKLHSMSDLSKSITRYGFQDPIKYSALLNGGSGGIATGNGRLKYLLWAKDQGQVSPKGIKAKGDDWYVPVVFGVDAEDENEAIAYSISHNLSALWGSDLTFLDQTKLFDEELLKDQLTGLADLDVALLPVGLDGDDLSLWLGLSEGLEEAEPEDEEALNDLLDKADEGQIESRVKLGEIWACGRHRVACGDSTREENIRALLGDRKIDLLFTDPPYGVSYADKNRSLNAVSKGNRIQTPIENDHLSPQETFDNLWLPVFSNLIKFAKPGCSYYVCAPQGGDQMMMMIALKQSGWLVKHELIWVKNNHVLGRADYHYKHEPILYGWEPSGPHYFTESRSETSVWNFDKPIKSDLHPTMKPVALVSYAISNSSRPKELIFDAFLGSGSTMIAAQQMEGDRTVFGFELSEAYCEVILQRFSVLTGIEPELVGHL